MKALFDYQIFCAQTYGGVSRYFAGLVEELAKLDGVDPRVLAPLYVNAYLGRLPNESVIGRRVAQIPRTGRALNLVNELLSRTWSATHAAPDIIHHTYYAPFKDGRGGPRRVVTVYDMIHERFPKGFSARDKTVLWKANAVLSADHVLCISEQTRRDLLEFVNVPEDRVSVTLLGSDSLADLVTEPDARAFRERVLGVDVPYLLYVGQRGNYKNFEGLLNAFARNAKLSGQYMLLCCGGGRFSAAEQEAIANLGLAQRVRVLSATDADLANSYRHALVFVYPSLYEGFGIPPLEAMSVGCPVACSNSSSIPEVVGDAAEMFDPVDVDAMGEAILRVTESSLRRDELVAKGYARRLLFSWKNCAAQTLSAYRKVLS